jgi:hypothetical protein
MYSHCKAMQRPFRHYVLGEDVMRAYWWPCTTLRGGLDYFNKLSVDNHDQFFISDVRTELSVWHEIL